MRSRKAFITKSPFQIPDFGCYEPKYNLIEKRQYDSFFDKKAKKKLYYKKFLHLMMSKLIIKLLIIIN